jgi:hypothetical protein
MPRWSSSCIGVASLAALACGFPSYDYLPCEPGSSACSSGTDASSPDVGANDAGASDTGVDAAVNLVEEPGCELGVGFWNAYDATLKCDSSEHRTGNASFLVSFDGTPGATFFSLTRAKALVEKPAMGATYVITAWIRSSVPGGRSSTVILREEGGASAAVEVTSPIVTTAPDWRKLTVTMTIGASDRTSLTGHVVQFDAASGDSFNVDDVELILKGPQ